MRSDGGRFSDFVAVRLVRLTIETNAVTGTISSTNPIYGRSSHLYLSWPGYRFRHTLYRLSRRLKSDLSHFTSYIFPSTQNDVYYVFTYVLSFYFVACHADGD